MNASPVFLGILSAVSSRVHHPLDPAGPGGVLSQLGFIKGRSTGTEEDEQKGREDSNTFSTHHDLYPAWKPYPGRIRSRDEFPMLFDTTTAFAVSICIPLVDLDNADSSSVRARWSRFKINRGAILEEMSAIRREERPDRIEHEELFPR